MLDELVKKELSQEEPTEISIDDVVKYDLVLKKSKIFLDEELRKEELRIISELAESLFEVRLSKVIEGKSIKGFDESIFEVINIMKQFYIDLFTGKYIINRNKIYCKALKRLQVNNYEIKEGDIVLLPIKDAFPLIIARYLTPYKLNNEE